MKVTIVDNIESILPIYMLKNGQSQIPNSPGNTSFDEDNKLPSNHPTVFLDNSKTIDEIDEELLERLLNFDDVAGYKFTSKFTKIRQLQRATINELKNIYQGYCQLCERNIAKEFGVDISEAHHIEYFSISMNNKYDNIVILCPNHHTLIHKTNPVFDKENKMFIFSNGSSFKLKLNKHL